MTQAERIRKYYKEYLAASYEEVAEAVKAGRCVLLEDKTLDYSAHFGASEALADLVDWKNDTRREWVEMLTRAAEKETDSNTMRLLIKEANKMMKEVTK